MATESHKGGRRRRSMDDMDNFARMEEVVSQLEEICKKVKQRKKKVPAKAAFAATAAGAAACFLAAPFTGGFSLIALGGAGAVTAVGAVVVTDKITDRSILNKVKSLVNEFCEMAQSLMDVRKEKHLMTENLDAAAKEIIMRLESLIKDLFVLFVDFEKDSTVQCLLEVTQLCKNILQKLEEFRETF